MTKTETTTETMKIEIVCPACGTFEKHATNYPAIVHPDNSIAQKIEVDPFREVWCSNCERVTTLGLAKIDVLKHNAIVEENDGEWPW